MQIVLRGKNVDISPKLRAVTEDKLTKLERFAHDAGRVEVEFSEVRNPRVADREVCEVTVHLKRHFVKARAAAGESSAALDLVVDKVEHQLVRLKERRVSRLHARRRPATVWTPMPDEAFERSEPDEDEPALVVKTKRFTLKPMGLEEAALQMELLGHSFFLFTNADTGQAAVVYRRHDGHLGLIEAVG